MIDSLNLKSQRATVSELEATLLVCAKLLDRQLEQNPKAGMVLSPNCRIRYKQCKKTLEELYSKFSLAGAFSIGCCQTCSYFNAAYSTTGTLGRCPNKSDYVHAFDTCDKHSKSGAGFGRA